MITRRLLKKKSPSTLKDEPGLDISSLIDVSFLLLIFFIATSTLQPRESQLGMTLPGPPGEGNPHLGDPYSISVQANGNVIANDELLETDLKSRELPNLLDRLKMYKQAADLSASKPVIVVYADDSAKSQRFIDVMNCLADAKIESITFGGF